MTTDLNRLFTDRLTGTRQAIDAVAAMTGELAAAATALLDALAGGGTVYTCGNGGSAAEALHLAEELIGRYRTNRPPQRAICLNADATALTCISNDFGYDQAFARQCEALLVNRDVLVVFTTSGNSANIVKACEVARQRRAIIIGLLGGDGGATAVLCNHPLIIPMTDSAHVQEAHQVMMHLFCEVVELQLGGARWRL